MLVAAALHDVIGEMNNITRRMSVTAQQVEQGMVQQIGRIDVDLQHAGERFAEWRTGFFGKPGAGIMDNGAQPGGGRSHFISEGQNTVIG